MATDGGYQSNSGNMFIRADWSRTSVDVANNTSTITVNVNIGSSYTVSSSATKNGSVTINGQKSDFTFTIGTYGNGWSKTIKTFSVVVPHNSDGTKTISISAWADVQINLSSGYVGRLSVSGSPTLDTIPRASSFASLTAAIDAGSALSYTIAPASSGLSHQIWMSFHGNGNTPSATVNVPAGTTTGNWTFPLSTTWLASIPNSTSGTLKVYLRTMSGTTKIGERVYSVTVRVPSSVTPTISSVSLVRSGSAPSAWGLYVQNKSTVEGTINGATGIYGSSIVDYKLTLVNVTKGGPTGWRQTFSLPSPGTFYIQGKVTDSRGRTKTMNSPTFTVISYSPPNISSVSLSRQNSDGSANDEGTTGKAVVRYSYSSLSGKNPLTTKIEYKPKSSSTWTNGGTLPASGTSKTFGSSALSTNTVYDVRATLTDQFQTVTYTGQISTAFVTMDFLAGGRGIAIGKVATVSNTLDVAFDMNVDGAIAALGGFQPLRIPAGANLDNYTNPGVYYSPANTDVAGMPNSPPSNLAGALVVYPTHTLAAKNCIQYWHEYNHTGVSSNVWRRRRYTTWSPWLLYAGPQAMPQSGTSGASIAAGSSTTASVTVTFPTPYRTVPSVTLTSMNSSLVPVLDGTPTTTGFTWRAQMWNGTAPSAFTHTVHWIAVP